MIFKKEIELEEDSIIYDIVRKELYIISKSKWVYMEISKRFCKFNNIPEKYWQYPYPPSTPEEKESIHYVHIRYKHIFGVGLNSGEEIRFPLEYLLKSCRVIV